MGLNLATAAILMFMVADAALGDPRALGLYAVRIAGLVYLGTLALILRRVERRRGLVRLALMAVGAMIVGAAGTGVINGDAMTTRVLCGVVCVAVAAIVPWGRRPQMLTAGLAATAIIANSVGTGVPLGYSALAGLMGCLVSLPIAGEIDRRRRSALAAQKEEREVATRLANVGDRLTLSASEPGTLLSRICRLVAEALDASMSHTFIFEGDALVCTAAYGETPREAEVYEESRLPRAAVSGLVERVRKEGAVLLSRAEAQEFRDAPPRLKHGTTMAIYFPLRRGQEIIGIQSAEYRGRSEPLPPARIRLARGISHLASLALESARLVHALEAADRVKTNFLANMSHELRTPLNVIIGYNDLLLEGAFDPLTTEQSRTLQRVQNSARELLELVTTTLELSRSDGRTVQPQLHELRVDLLVDDVIEEMRAVPRKAGLRLVVNAPQALPPVRTDRRLLKMILKNLVDNALKFTERGRVTIETIEAEGGVLLRVADTGIGIPPEEVERIFEPFHRGASPTIQRQGGVGLGLYIVQRLVESLEGRIEVQSVVGHGTTFSVWIPFSPAQADERARHLAEVG
jgi:signal transduction histidine kinase